MTLESSLQTELLLVAPDRLPGLRLFRRNVLVARIGERKMRAGVKGQADLYGYVRGGRVVEIELKSATGRLSPEQKAWADWCVEWGVPHLVLSGRTDESIEQTIERWVGELREAIKWPTNEQPDRIV